MQGSNWGALGQSQSFCLLLNPASVGETSKFSTFPWAFLFGLIGLRPPEDLHWQRHGGQTARCPNCPMPQLCLAEPEPHEFPDESGAAARPGVMTLDTLGVLGQMLGL